MNGIEQGIMNYLERSGISMRDTAEYVYEPPERDCVLCGGRLGEFHYGDVCAICHQETEQGYQIRYLMGRCANGAERDSGTLWHAIPLQENDVRGSVAMCGITYGRRSAGWSDHRKLNQPVTCKRCLKKIERM